MDRRGVSAMVLRRPANVAWYTGGADSRVDHVVAEGVADPIVRRQAVAWNPSITGAKAEETFVLTETGPEVAAGSFAPAGAVA